MIKVILIEDRVFRQANLLGEKLSDLGKYSFLKNIAGGKEFEEIKEKLCNSEFSVLNDYDVIMLHRSAFDTTTRNGLIDFLKKTKKKAVFFSGGIASSHITKIGNFEFLLINVSQFYSENLILFLGNGAQNLLEISFGENWQISNLVDAYDKLTLYTKSFKDRPWTRIEEDLKLNSWIKDKYFTQIQQNNLVRISDIVSILEKMNNDLKKLL